jgi:hypothetical protein
MKFLETHFEEYIQSSLLENLHPKLEKIFNKFPKKITDFRNLIFYGPSGVGKYTQMLNSIKNYSPTNLKYEKKISVTYNKQQYFFKISDIHYEIDMSLLGCNSKLLWHDIYLQLIDIISAKTEKSGIIVCKYFHEIHSELLENFYSYMQQNMVTVVDLKFILITEELSFIPDNILNNCEVINVARPTKTLYNKCIKLKANTLAAITTPLENITNIKNLHASITQLTQPHKIICDKIMDSMLNVDELKFLKFRDLLYDIFIYNLDITDSIWYILSTLINQKKIKPQDLSNMLIKTYTFFQYYNNNYRPIFHLENYLFFLISIIHEYGLK